MESRDIGKAVDFRMGMNFLDRRIRIVFLFFKNTADVPLNFFPVASA
jgi:hypothetical protein